jgi:adenylate cyclase
LLSGSVRRRGPDVRVTMKMVSTADGQRIWSQWYDRPYEAFYKYQDSLIAATDGAVMASVMIAEGARSADRPVEELDAFGLLCRAWNNEYHHQTSDAVTLAERAVAIDPEYGLAYAVLAIELSNLVTSMSSQDIARDSARAVECADRALALEPNGVNIVSYACAVHGRHGNETLAMKLAEKATNLGGKPNRYHYLVLIAAGRSEDVFELAQGDGSPPQGQLALADMLAERWEEAVERFEIVATADSRGWVAWSHLANALAMVDRLDEARDAVARVKSIRPDWTLDLWEQCNRLAWRNREEIVEASLLGLRKLDVE